MVYDDVFGGPPKYTVQSFVSSGDGEGYEEIFRGFSNGRSAAAAASVPFLEIRSEHGGGGDVFLEEDVYKSVFGGSGGDFAVGYDEMFLGKVKRSCSGDTLTRSNCQKIYEQPRTFFEASEKSSSSSQNVPSNDKRAKYSSKSKQQEEISCASMNDASKANAMNGITTHQLGSPSGQTIVQDCSYQMVADEETANPVGMNERNIVGPVNRNTEDLPLQSTSGNSSLNGREDLKEDVNNGNYLEEGSNIYVKRHSNVSADARGDDKFVPREEFVTVTDINLCTKPTQLPPPSRRPPKLATQETVFKKKNFASTNGYHMSIHADDFLPKNQSNQFADVFEVFSVGDADKQRSLPYLDVEVDANSAAAASAAAVKQVMEKARVKLQIAKESMERRKNTPENQQKLAGREGQKLRVRREHETKLEFSREETEVVPDARKDRWDMKECAREESHDQTSTSFVKFTTQGNESYSDHSFPRIRQDGRPKDVQCEQKPEVKEIKCMVEHCVDDAEIWEDSAMNDYEVVELEGQYMGTENVSIKMDLKKEASDQEKGNLQETDPETLKQAENEKMANGRAFRLKKDVIASYNHQEQREEHASGDLEIKEHLEVGVGETNKLEDDIKKLSDIECLEQDKHAKELRPVPQAVEALPDKLEDEHEFSQREFVKKKEHIKAPMLDTNVVKELGKTRFDQTINNYHKEKGSGKESESVGIMPQVLCEPEMDVSRSTASHDASESMGKRNATKSDFVKAEYVQQKVNSTAKALEDELADHDHVDNEITMKANEQMEDKEVREELKWEVERERIVEQVTSNAETRSARFEATRSNCRSEENEKIMKMNFDDGNCIHEKERNGRRVIVTSVVVIETKLKGKGHLYENAGRQRDQVRPTNKVKDDRERELERDRKAAHVIHKPEVTHRQDASKQGHGSLGKEKPSKTRCEISGQQDAEKARKVTVEVKDKDNVDNITMQRERELTERMRKLQEEQEREREREKDRIAVGKDILGAREKRYGDGWDRSGTDTRDRTTWDSCERAERTYDAADARERAALKTIEKAAAEAREQMEKAASERYHASLRERDMKSNEQGSTRVKLEINEVKKETSDEPLQARHSSEKRRQNAEETEKRRQAILDRHNRTAERAAKALAEKKARDILAQREQAERHRLAETLDAEIKRWSSGKEGNLRALISTLQYILWPRSGWQPVPLTEVITSAAVKKAYRKATLCLHPDKVQQRGATVQQKYISEKVFDLLKEAWNRFNSEES